MNKNCHQSSTNCWRVDLRDGPRALTSTCKAGVDNVLTKNISLWFNSKTYCTKKNKQTNNVEHAFTCRANQTFILKITVSRKNCRETPRQNHDVTLMATCRANNGIWVSKALSRKYRNTALFSRHLYCTHYAAGRDSVIATATGYGLDGSWIDSQFEERDLPHPYRPVLGPTQPPVRWIPGHCPGVKRPGLVVGRLPLSSSEVQERVEL